MDTLKLAEDIERAGFTSAQARGLAHAIGEGVAGAAGLATKEDLAELRAATQRDMAELKVELKTDIAELKAELTTDIAKLEAKVEATLRGEIGAVRGEVNSLWRKTLALLVAQLGVLVAIIELRLRLP